LAAGLLAARRELAERLQERREEIERGVATRVFAIAEPSETADPEYLEGLRDSLATALEFAFGAIERGERRAPDVPPSLLAQARMAARAGVSLDTVLRRYFAGYSLVLEFILDVDVDVGGAGGGAPTARRASLREVLRGHAAVFDRLVAAVSEEHRREAAGLLRSAAERRAERVRRLLAGEPIDAAELGYELRGFHVGLAGSGPDVEATVLELAMAAKARVLALTQPDARTWAWLGSARPFAAADVAGLLARAAEMLSPGAALGFGEPAEGLDGWRLSHRQAVVALPMARRLGPRAVRYADAGLLASVTADDLLLESLRRMYLVPLSTERDGGETLRETLRAYFATARNINSTAAALGVNRETVRRRLRSAEERLERPIDECAAELEIALRLDRRRERLSARPASAVRPPAT
jgi:PucR-like helix-turn-helix protein/diguanylate cyclase with GGDEF domain